MRGHLLLFFFWVENCNSKLLTINVTFMWYCLLFLSQIEHTKCQQIQIKLPSIWPNWPIPQQSMKPMDGTINIIHPNQMAIHRGRIEMDITRIATMAMTIEVTTMAAKQIPRMREIVIIPIRIRITIGIIIIAVGRHLATEITRIHRLYRDAQEEMLKQSHPRYVWILFSVAYYHRHFFLIDNLPASMFQIETTTDGTRYTIGDWRCWTIIGNRFTSKANNQKYVINKLPIPLWFEQILYMAQSPIQKILCTAFTYFVTIFFCFSIFLAPGTFLHAQTNGTIFQN